MFAFKSVLVALTFSAGLLTSGLSPASALDPGDDEPLPSLTLPEGPTIPMPPGAEVFGPQGGSRDPFPQLPGPNEGTAPSQAKPDSPAAENAAPPKTAQQRRQARVDELLSRLAEAQDETEAGAILAMVDRIWLQSGSDTADLLMARAISAIQSSDYKLAETLLDKVITLQPSWPEAWNKRATVHFLDDEDSASMEDISHVLALEPRHFGALSGMGYILHRNGDDKDALMVFRKAAAVNPQNKDVKTLIDELTPEVEGQDL